MTALLLVLFLGSGTASVFVARATVSKEASSLMTQIEKSVDTKNDLAVSRSLSKYAKDANRKVTVSLRERLSLGANKKLFSSRKPHHGGVLFDLYSLRRTWRGMDIEIKFFCSPAFLFLNWYFVPFYLVLFALLARAVVSSRRRERYPVHVAFAAASFLQDFENSLSTLQQPPPAREAVEREVLEREPGRRLRLVVGGDNFRGNLEA